MSAVLAIGEQREGRIERSAQEAVSTAARLAAELGTHAEALAVGAPGLEQAAGSLGEFGARKVTVAVHDALSSYHPEGYLEVIEPLIRQGRYQAVILTASSQGRDLAPRLAARLDVPLFQDVTGVLAEAGRVEVTRPIYSGKALMRARSETVPLLLTLRLNAFPVLGGGDPVSAEPSHPAVDPDGWATRITGFRSGADESPDTSQAAIVVSGGRGMKDPGQWGLLDELRRSLGPEAGLGASRAVVDAGWRPHAEQVGQTGKTVSPRLYFAIGISGAAQHLAGMRTAGTIVAINRDPEAPIFKVADYGIVGDALEIVPRLSEEIRGLKAQDATGSRESS